MPPVTIMFAECCGHVWHIHLLGHGQIFKYVVPGMLGNSSNYNCINS